jgi:hypothetical protein
MTPQDYQQLSWWKKAFAWLDRENDRVLGYHGPPGSVSKSKEVIGELWLAAALHADGNEPAEKAVQYCQCQLDVTKTGGVECVTTSAVIVRNIVRDELAARQGKPPAPQEITAQAFVDQLDTARLGAWNKRLSSGVPVIGGFMHPVLQLPHALDLLAGELKDTYGLSFSHVFTSGNTLDDLVDNLQNNRPTLIHGIWSDRRVIDLRSGVADLNIANILGGSPHTMPLAMVSSRDEWSFYDLGWKPGQPGSGFVKMSSDELMSFWGRCYPLASYTKRFSMTTITIDQG